MSQQCECKIVHQFEFEGVALAYPTEHIQQCPLCASAPQLKEDNERLRALSDLESVKKEWLDLVSGNDEIDAALVKLRASILHFVGVVVVQDNELRKLNEQMLVALRLTSYTFSHLSRGKRTLDAVYAAITASTGDKE